MTAYTNPINAIEGGAQGTPLKTVRAVDDELDEALTAANSNIATKRKENDVTIAHRLADHGWTRYDIRKVLLKKNHRESLLSRTDDTYFHDVLDEAGYHQRRYNASNEVVDTGDYSSDDDEEGDESDSHLFDLDGVTSDSVDSSDFSDVKF